MKDWKAPRPGMPLWAEVCIGLALLSCYLIVDGAQHPAAPVPAKPPVYRLLLEPSSKAANLDDCERAKPNLPRPDGVINAQHGALMPWHRRVCIWVGIDPRKVS